MRQSAVQVAARHHATAFWLRIDAPFDRGRHLHRRWGARHRQPKINPRRPGLASVAADAVQNRKEAGTAGSIGELAKCTSAQRLGTDFVGINAKSD